MQDHAADPEVFIRSLATRGTLGGLSRSAADTMRVLDAWGADVILVETVGVGQDELEITRTAQTTLVVMAPGLGDDIQASKAGLLECADVFAVNKADREGADGTVRDLELMIALGGEVTRMGGKSRAQRGHTAAMLDIQHHVSQEDDATWTPPILKTIATRRDSVDVLFEKLELHRGWLLESEAGAVRRAARLAEALRGELREALLEAALESLGPQIEAAALSVGSHAIDPYSAADALVDAFRKR
jgi:LAO/AO transport system kinase